MRLLLVPLDALLWLADRLSRLSFADRRVGESPSADGDA